MLMSQPPFCAHDASAHTHNHANSYHPYSRLPAMKRESPDSAAQPSPQDSISSSYYSVGLIAGQSGPPSSRSVTQTFRGQSFGDGQTFNLSHLSAVPSPASSSSSASYPPLNSAHAADDFAPTSASSVTGNDDTLYSGMSNNHPNEQFRALLALEDVDDEGSAPFMMPTLLNDHNSRAGYDIGGDVHMDASGAIPPGWRARKDERAVRRRSSKACDQCRKSKCKCERSSPDGPCRNCTLLGVQCTFLGPSRKRGPPKGYIDALEARMHQAEAVVGILHMIGKDKSVGDVMNAMKNDELGRSILERIEVGPYGASGRARGVTLQAKRKLDGGNLLDEEEEERVPLEQTHPKQDWQDQLMEALQQSTSHPASSSRPTCSSAMTCTDGSWASCSGSQSTQYYGHSSGLPAIDQSSIVDLFTSTLPEADLDVIMPGADELRTMAKAYFAHPHHMMPIFDQDTFLAAATQPSAMVEDMPQELLYAALACVTVFGSESSMSDKFATKAYAQLSHVSSVSSLKVLLLLSFHAVSGSPARAWALSGQATRMAVDLGFHRERAAPDDVVKQHERQVLWMACLVLDAATSAMAGRAPSISVHDYDMILPSIASAKSLSEEIFAATASLACIISNLLSSLYATRSPAQPQSSQTQLSASLDQWKRSLPPSLRIREGSDDTMSTDDVASGPLVAMHMLYWTAVELIHRAPSCSSPTGNDVVRSARATLRLASQEDVQSACGWAPWCIFRAGLIWRDACARYPDDQETQDSFVSVIDQLRTLGENSPIAGGYAKLLANAQMPAPVPVALMLPTLPASVSPSSAPTCGSSSAPPSVSTYASAPSYTGIPTPSGPTLANSESMPAPAPLRLALPALAGPSLPSFSTYSTYAHPNGSSSASASIAPYLNPTSTALIRRQSIADDYVSVSRNKRRVTDIPVVGFTNASFSAPSSAAPLTSSTSGLRSARGFDYSLDNYGSAAGGWTNPSSQTTTTGYGYAPMQGPGVPPPNPNGPHSRPVPVLDATGFDPSSFWSMYGAPDSALAMAYGQTPSAQEAPQVLPNSQNYAGAHQSTTQSQHAVRDGQNQGQYYGGYNTYNSM